MGHLESVEGSGGSVAGRGDVVEKFGTFRPAVGGEGGVWLGVNVLLLVVLEGFGCERMRRRRRGGREAMVEMGGERGREEAEVAAAEERRGEKELERLGFSGESYLGKI